MVLETRPLCPLKRAAWFWYPAVVVTGRFRYPAAAVTGVLAQWFLFGVLAAVGVPKVSLKTAELRGDIETEVSLGISDRGWRESVAEVWPVVRFPVASIPRPVPPVW